MILSLLPHHISLHHSSLTLRVSSSAAVSIAVRAQGPIVPVLFMFKWFIFHFRPPLLELDFCKSALSVVLVGFIHGSQLSGWFLVENQFIIKCFEINLNTVKKDRTTQPSLSRKKAHNSRHTEREPLHLFHKERESYVAIKFSTCQNNLDCTHYI